MLSLITQWPSRLVQAMFIIIILTRLTGCVNYSGIHGHQQLTKLENLQISKSLPSADGTWPSTAWANQFADLQLVNLINEGLANNPDLKITAARLAEAEALAELTKAQLFPGIVLQAASARQRFTANSFYPPPYGGGWLNQGQAALNLAYDFDFWGKNYQAMASALSAEKASAAAHQQAKIMLSSMIATVYNQLAFNYALADVLQRMVVQQQMINKITVQRLQNGLDSRLQLYQSQNTEAAVRTQLTAIKGQIEVTKQQLGVLVGAGPDRGLAIKRPIMTNLKSPKLPPNLPINLMGRRPDIVAARWQVEAALHGVKSAKASFYPDINLIASVGYLSFGLDKLFQSASKNIMMQPAVNLPIFDADALRAELKRQFAKLDEAIARYNAALNKAFGEIAEHLTAIKSLDAQLIMEKQALDAAEHSFALAKKQYRSGLTSELVMLIAETSYLTEQQTRLNLLYKRQDLQIALIKSLGGGFKE